MFTLTYDAPTVRGMERYATRAEAEAEAEAVRAAMIAVGYGAHLDSIVIREDRELTADEALLEVEAARLTLEAAEDEAAGTYAGSDEWYAVGVADDALRDAEHELSRARAREARAERAAGERAAAARYAAEAEAERRAYAYRAPIYGRGN